MEPIEWPLRRVRTIFGIISVISLIFSAYLSSVLSFKASSNPPLYINLIYALIFSFNISILFAWAWAGIAGGAAVGALCVIVVILLALRMGRSEYLLFAASFLAATLAGYLSARFKNRTRQAHVLRFERLEEDTNLLANSIKEKEANIVSLEDKLTRYSKLKEVVERLSTTLSLDDINELIVENTAHTLAKPGRVLLFLVDARTQDLMLAASRGDSVSKEKKGDIFDHWMLKNRKSLIIESTEKDYRFPADDINASEKTCKSLITAPLVSESKVTGILRMDSTEESAYTQDDLRLLDIISGLSAVAVQNAYLYSRTQELAIRDDLTGLVVRRYFMERFHEEIIRAGRKKEPLSLLIIDIDHFKDYNDRYGHMAGDIVLKYMAGLLTGAVREGDIVGRYGGEEIVVLLLGRDKSEAVKDAEKIRRAIKDKPLIFRHKKTNLTVSAGISSYPKDSVTENDLIRIADERMYKAKSAGRDRVCSE